MSLFEDIAYAPTEQNFQDACIALQVFLGGVKQFGHVASSRAEGAHAYPITWLYRSSGDLERVWMSKELSTEAQRDIITQQLSSDKTKGLSAYPYPR
ncbi:hypothetical protein CCR75_001950 [Bremia lactucae]|uniref:Uncharacterized protein n=1 Tax=Bremia lactucae TaxID=4779 RepID=A0A976IDU0_BRELC|nr:hypothetical protein CCR75_001950 [Bremia lactucae]